ncbi:MAG: DUF3592 domain-containing protein [Galactobacter sp.]
MSDGAVPHFRGGRRRSSSGAWSWVTPVIAFALAACMIVGGIVAWQNGRHDAATLTATAKARIVEAHTHREADTDRDRPRSHYSCRFTYAFTAGGSRVTGHDEDSGACTTAKHAPGTERSVHYDPESPNHSSAHDPKTHNHWWIVMEIVGLLCLAWGGGSIWFRRYLSRSG